MYFDLESNILAYMFNNVNKVYGDTKPLVVSPPVLRRLEPPCDNREVRDPVKTSVDEYLGELVELKNTSEITVTFKPVYRQKYTDIEIGKVLRLMLQSYNITYILVPEYGKGNNLHYHGIVTGFSNIKSRMKKELNQLIGRTTINGIQYTQSYLEYMKKERSLIDPLIYDKLIIYNIK